ncbi:MAG: hypothetical protein CMI60_17815 [Parvibaculum sp.]|nr:hypothetical protein [Parvibaculum sp.]
MRLGGRVITNFGRAGQRAADYVGHGIDTVGRIPLFGDALVGSAPIQGLRGLVGGANMAAKGTTGIGQILEKTGAGLQSLMTT